MLRSVQDLDEVQAMLLLKRWLKDNAPHLTPEQLPESDPVAVNELLLQVPGQQGRAA